MMRQVAIVLSGRASERRLLFSRMTPCKWLGTAECEASFLAVIFPHELEQIAAHVEHQLVVLERYGIASTIEQQADHVFGDIEFLTIVRPSFGSRGEGLRCRHGSSLLSLQCECEKSGYRVGASRSRNTPCTAPLDTTDQVAKHAIKKAAQPKDEVHMVGGVR
jgi:hypothetical protein